jgi:hypothetical protein
MEFCYRSVFYYLLGTWLHSWSGAARKELRFPSEDHVSATAICRFLSLAVALNGSSQIVHNRKLGVQLSPVLDEPCYKNGTVAQAAPPTKMRSTLAYILIGLNTDT